jgi:predicted esterase
VPEQNQGSGRRVAPTLLIALLAAAIACVATSPVQAAKLLLKDGRTLDGEFARISGVADSTVDPKTQSGEVVLAPILVVDDGLRRTYIHTFQVSQVLEQASTRPIRIRVWQDVAEHGAGIGRAGQAVRVTPFDEYGRRIYEMQTPDGLLSVVQGITQITPVYTKVEGLMGGTRPIVWDMRIATSSIPRETLDRILHTAVPQNDVEARLQVVRLYVQSQRYHEARDALEQIVKDFPDRQDLAPEIRQLRQLASRLVMDEIKLRGKAGQHELVRKLLTEFPSDGVAGETMQEVRQRLADYDAADQRVKSVLAELNAEIARISDPNGRKLAEQFAQEIAADVNEDTMRRLASFERLADAADLSAEQKVALAISGWLVGANQATDNFHVAVALATVRDKVRQYLREPVAADRTSIANELHDMEGATVQRVAQLLKLMKPPVDVPADAKRGPGFYELSVAGLTGGPDSRYLVQLPPEYDPLRHYPTIVTLAGAGFTAEQQLDFWAGAADKGGTRLGQAGRHGYIVIAVDWQQPHQFTYEYSAQEHHAVLGALRDACRRFAVDTDRVFLTGHGIGGDAAWDIGLAHPDLWAGVIPFVAVADRYVTRYGDNARYVNWYIVAGELDGDKMTQNSRELDRYLRPTSDATVVEYLGRGYESFSDEIQRIFDWMGRRQRSMPREFECVTLRPWDNFFWWLEVSGLPEKAMVSPSNWPPSRGTRPLPLRSKLTEGNKVMVFEQAQQTTVWLGPEMVDFEQPLVVELNGRSISPRNHYVTPDLEVLLEDARARADRQHPFWAKVTSN